MNSACASFLLNFGIGSRRLWSCCAGGNRPVGSAVSIRSLTALRLSPGEVQTVGHPGQFRQRSRLHLSHHLATMDFYRDFADADLVGNLLVETAGCDQGHYLTLAGREGLEARPQPGESFLVLQPGTVVHKAELDRVQQILVAEGLGQELDR